MELQGMTELFPPMSGPVENNGMPEPKGYQQLRDYTAATYPEGFTTPTSDHAGHYLDVLARFAATSIRRAEDATERITVAAPRVAFNSAELIRYVSDGVRLITDTGDCAFLDDLAHTVAAETLTLKVICEIVELTGKKSFVSVSDEVFERRVRERYAAQLATQAARNDPTGSTHWVSFPISPQIPKTVFEPFSKNMYEIAVALATGVTPWWVQ